MESGQLLHNFLQCCHNNSDVMNGVVNQMLTQLDGVEALQGVYVLAPNYEIRLAGYFGFML